MRRFPVIILAGGEKGPLYEPTGFETKALIPIHGKPMIDWVIEAFVADERVSDIVVVGGEELEQCASMRFVRKRIHSGINLMQNILSGVAYVKSAIHHGNSEHDGYLFSFCDAVFLNPEIIHETIDNIEKAAADIVLHYVEKTTFEKAELTAKRTYIPIQDKFYTGSTIYYIKQFSLVQKMLDTMSEMRKNRKDPHGLLRALDCEGLDLQGIEEKLSERVKAKLKIVVSEQAYLGMDVDKPSDLELAQELLPNPWKHDYKKAAIIYNPHSGQGLQIHPIFQSILGIKKRKASANENREELMQEALGYLKEYGVDAELKPTQHAGHASELARDLVADGYDLVIAAGGDGTINEVVNGLARSKTTLGIIPMGTANVMALELNLPVEIEAACQVIASGNHIKIDLGKANDRYFTCMAGVGFDAHVIQRADSKWKKVLGALAYPVFMIWELFFYHFKKISLVIDDQRLPRRGYFVIVSNGKYYAGKIPLAADADMQDGYLDVTIFKHRNIVHLIIYLLGIWRHQIDKLMSVEQFQCKRVRIEKHRKTGVHVDAEYHCATPVDITISHMALKVAK